MGRMLPVAPFDKVLQHATVLLWLHWLSVVLFSIGLADAAKARERTAMMDENCIVAEFCLNLEDGKLKAGNTGD